MPEPQFLRDAPWRPALLAAASLLAAAGCVQAPEPPPEPAATTRPVPTLGPDEAIPQPADSRPGATNVRADQPPPTADHDHPDRHPRRP